MAAKRKAIHLEAEDDPIETIGPDHDAPEPAMTPGFGPEPVAPAYGEDGEPVPDPLPAAPTDVDRDQVRPAGRRSPEAP